MPRLAAIGVLLAVALSASSTSQAVDTERRDSLRRLLTHDCGACHGMRLSGGLGSPLTAEALLGKSRDYLASVIRNGIDGTAMPGWQALLSDADIAWLVEELAHGGRTGRAGEAR